MSSLLRIEPLYVKKFILLLDCEILLNNFEFIKGEDFLFQNSVYLKEFLMIFWNKLRERSLCTLRKLEMLGVNCVGDLTIFAIYGENLESFQWIHVQILFFYSSQGCFYVLIQLLQLLTLVDCCINSFVTEQIFVLKTSKNTLNYLLFL